MRTDVPLGRIHPAVALVAVMRQEMRPHRKLAVLAAKQYGVVSHRQLEALGYSIAAIQRAVSAGRLHHVGRGVFAVGHPAVPPHGLALGAVLGAGEGAVLSHESAAWLWGLLPSFARPPHVTLPQRGHRKSTAHIHHSTILEANDLAVYEEIPTTAVPRTHLDLAATVNEWLLNNAIERAERRGLLDIAATEDLLERCGRHRGRRKLILALQIYRTPIFSRARSERLLLALIQDAGLPVPVFNTFVAGHEVDAYWAAEKFAVEVDGWGAHRTRIAFERDPVRQEDLLLAGITCIRITARRIEREPKAVAARLAQHLAQRRVHRPPD
jgi:very-short-patch-repair endonuclease